MRMPRQASERARQRSSISGMYRTALPARVASRSISARLSSTVLFEHAKRAGSVTLIILKLSMESKSACARRFWPFSGGPFMISRGSKTRNSSNELSLTTEELNAIDVKQRHLFELN